MNARFVGVGLIVAAAFVGAIVAVTWQASSPLVFLLYPALVLGALGLVAMAVLWSLRHF